jgi:hypothetical protein
MHDFTPTMFSLPAPHKSFRRLQGVSHVYSGISPHICPTRLLWVSTLSFGGAKSLTQVFVSLVSGLTYLFSLLELQAAVLSLWPGGCCLNSSALWNAQEWGEGQGGGDGQDEAQGRGTLEGGLGWYGRRTEETLADSMVSGTAHHSKRWSRFKIKFSTKVSAFGPGFIPWLYVSQGFVWSHKLNTTQLTSYVSCQRCPWQKGFEYLLFVLP